VFDAQCLEELFALFFEDTFTSKNYPDISLSPLVDWLEKSK
jgi:hypothetical protein